MALTLAIVRLKFKFQISISYLKTTWNIRYLKVLRIKNLESNWTFIFVILLILLLLLLNL